MIKQEEFIVTARKWRPLKFKDVVGQEHITSTLLNAIKSGRIHHAYLFCGPRGVGKTTTARILARALNCLSPEDHEPCNKCENCLSIVEGRSLDVIEIDGASNNSVDDIRKLRENAKYPPVSGKYKMYIIDEVHMLSTSAFNALLKTLEEPPPHLMFVFATTESHKLPATIISRCQRFDFRRMENEDIIGQLKYIAGRESITIDEESLVTIARKADGSMRDAQSIFDQVIAFCGTNVVYTEMAESLHLIDQEFFFRISRSILDKNVSDMFTITREVVNKGYDLQECLHGMLEHFRNLLTIKVTDSTDLVEGSGSVLDRYSEEAEHFSRGDLLRIMNLISATEQAMRYTPQPRIRFELALVQLATMDTSVEITTLLDEIRSLKKGNPGVLETKSEARPTSQTMITKEPQTSFRSTSPKVTKEREASAEAKKSEPEKSPLKEVEAANQHIKRGGTAGELADGWTEFVTNYGNGVWGLSTLNHTTPKFLNHEIILVAENDFVAKNLIQKKNLILEALEEFFGEKINIKITVKSGESDNEVTSQEEASEDPVSEEPDNSKQTAKKTENKPIEANVSKPVTSRSVQTDSERHPAENAIIELFGAKQLPNPGKD